MFAERMAGSPVLPAVVLNLGELVKKAVDLGRTAWTGLVHAGFGSPSPKEEEPTLEIQVEAAVLTDVGCVRESNEDSIVFVRPEEPEQLREKGCLAVVADGMGGHEGGEVASGIAVAVIPEVYFGYSGNCREALEAAVESANREIYQAAAENPENDGMGTTCTALAIKGGAAYCSHVGDSRLYLVRMGETRQMTEDHSLVMEMVRSGIISVEEARHHPSRNVITRSVGTDSSIEVSSWKQFFPVQDGDLFVLCSDGLHDYLEDGELLTCSETPDLAEACRRLVELAKSRGGKDNISVGLVRVGIPVPEQQAEAVLNSDG
jgi:serine/threonine protein phosphatase PrpC